MKNFRIVTAMLLALVIVFSMFVPTVNVFATRPSNTSDYVQISFGGNVSAITDVENGESVTLTYDHGTATVNGTGLYAVKEIGKNGQGQDVDKFNVYAVGSVTVTAHPNANYSANLREDGNLLGTHTKVYNLTAGGSPISLDVEFSDGSNPGGGSNGPVYIDGGTQVTSNFNYTANGEPADIWLNETEIGVGEPPAASKAYYYVESRGKVDFKFGILINNRITSIKINDVDYTSQLPTTKEGWLQVNQGQFDVVTITDVPYNATYNIETTSTRDFDWSVGNFLWSYQDKDKGTDDYIGNGTLEFVSLKYKGTTYNSLSQLQALNKPYMDFGENTHEGGAVLPAGAELTVKLLPKAGYQLTSFSCNGEPFETQEQIGCYTFEVPAGNFHWGATFSKVDNLVKANSNSIEGGKIDLGGTETSMAIGTARLDVTDVDLTDTQVKSFQNAAGDYKVASLVDVSLYNTVYKGTAQNSWDTEVTDLNNEATISLQLGDSINAEDVVVIHEKHDGTYEVKETSFNAETKELSYKTADFSNYAIAIKATEGTRNAPNPKTGDIIMIFVGIFAISTVGFIVTRILSKRK